MTAVVVSVRFLLELGALAALAWWGARSGGGVAGNIALAVAVPGAAALMWGVLAAPNSPRRLPGLKRLVPEVLLFGGATAALAAIDQGALAIAFGAVAVLDTALVHALERRDPSVNAGSAGAR